MCLVQNLSGQSACDSHASNLLCTPDRHCITHQGVTLAEGDWHADIDMHSSTGHTACRVSSGLALRLAGQEALTASTLQLMKGLLWYLSAAGVTLSQIGERHQRNSLVSVCCQAPVPDCSNGMASVSA